MLNIVFTFKIFNKEWKTNNCLFRFGCNRDFHLLGEKVTLMTLTWFFWWICNGEYYDYDENKIAIIFLWFWKWWQSQYARRREDSMVVVVVVTMLPGDFEDVDPKVSYCVGESWSHTKLPVCASESISSPFHSPNHPHSLYPLVQLKLASLSIHTKSTKHIPGNTCDQTSMLDIPYGEALSMLGGALYR